MILIFQILANGIVSISARGSTCTKIVSQNFEKRRSKSNEKICTEKANRWVRSNSQEYDEVPNDSRTLTRCQSGGTSEAAEAAANLAMLQLRKHYGDAIPIGADSVKVLKSPEYLEKQEKISMSPISSVAVNKLSLPLVNNTNFGGMDTRAIDGSENYCERKSPTPPPPPPHRTVSIQPQVFQIQINFN